MLMRAVGGNYMPWVRAWTVSCELASLTANSDLDYALKWFRVRL